MSAILAAVGARLKAEGLGFLRRHGGKLLIGCVVVAVLGAGLVVAIFTVLTGAQSASTADPGAASACRELGYEVDPALYAPMDQTVTVPTGGELPGFGSGEVEQQDVARAIVTAGQSAGVPEQGLVVAIATGLQESGLRNLAGGDRDSVNPFQQRPSQGWGTLEELMVVDFAARGFFGGPASPHWNAVLGRAEPPGLLDVPGWEAMSVTQAAQKVQRSGFPDAYAKHETRARTIVTAILGGTGTSTGTDTNAVDTGTGFESVSLRSVADYQGAGVDIEAYCVTTFTKPITPTAPYTGPSGSAGAWGGHANGRIPDSALAPIPWAPAHRLRPDATTALLALNNEFRARFGRDIAITDSYRTYAQQVAVKNAKGYLAATPGTSNHGWALALDLGGGINRATTLEYNWMRANAPRHGWDNPAWARPDGAKPEAWHWEYGKGSRP